MKTIDTHSHLLKRYYKDDFHNVISKLDEHKILSINIAFDIESSKEILNLSKQHSNLLSVIGIHPNDTNNIKDSNLIELEELINDNVIAIGEIGLDYHYEDYNIDKQKEIFIKQIELAQKYNLPIIIHTRDSLEDTYKIIKKYKTQKFLLHSWSGDKEMTNKFLSISDNIYFSYNGIITFNNAELQKQVLKIIPKDKILFETDCPYLTPVPNRGKINYPWMVKDIIKYCSNLLEITFDELNELNNNNSIIFFNLNGDLFK